MWTSGLIRQKFFEFYEAKGHKRVSPSSLVPENDPSVLFTSAGMQQFKGCYLNPENAPAARVVTIQPCFRTSDIDEVSDKSHLTLFEMLGNFSFGYERERGSMQMSTRINADEDLSLRGNPTRLDRVVIEPRREQSHKEEIATLPDSIVSARNDNNNPLLSEEGQGVVVDNPYFKKQTIEWAWEFLTSLEWLGLEKDKFVGTYFEGTDLLPTDKESASILKCLDGLKKIEAQNQEENFWGPTGVEGPCGPTVEFHYDGLEVWNLVFNEFYFSNNNYRELEKKGVDTGAGMERLLVVLNKMDNVYETDIFEPLLGVVRSFGIDDAETQRVITDHIKAAVFAIADGVLPSNKDAGYVVRRLIRRAMVAIGDQSAEVISALRDKVIEIYAESYPQLKKADYLSIDREVNKWEPIKKKGERILDDWAAKGEKISGKMTFDLYQSHGFPVELTRELAKERKLWLDEKGFWEELEKHKQVSKAGVEGKFKGGLAGHSEVETRYHTATHLLLQALRELLGEKVFQRGANINTERLRFDFSHPEPLTDDQLAEVEAVVNQKISENLPVVCEEMTQAEAEAKGAVGTFREKYGEKVKIYSIGGVDKPYSMEFCGGPHVENTSELGRFKIIKEQSAGAGIRRIRAILE